MFGVWRLGIFHGIFQTAFAVFLVQPIHTMVPTGSNMRKAVQSKPSLTRGYIHSLGFLDCFRAIWEDHPKGDNICHTVADRNQVSTALVQYVF